MNGKGLFLFKVGYRTPSEGGFVLPFECSLAS
jgi:hypothetical protein